NQLLSSKTYLEQPETVARGFRIITYFDNNFVRALGFVTLLFDQINAENINEIVVDSTFKTNQERFELFVVNANCGEYGMPLAYLYLLVSDNIKEVCYYPEDEITTRIQSRKTNLQLCYWHLENAISRRLKDKKPQSNTYSKQKVLEAHQKFSFIDPLWIPASKIKSLCSEELFKEIINIIKQHANMHSLILVDKDPSAIFQENNSWIIADMIISGQNSALENPVIEGSCSENLKTLELYKREIDNDNFVKNFDKLVGPFVKAIGECEKALQSHT
ncbi:13678_t:CDS:2, partial [Cetraspora pellucida]